MPKISPCAVALAAFFCVQSISVAQAQNTQTADDILQIQRETASEVRRIHEDSVADVRRIQKEGEAEVRRINEEGAKKREPVVLASENIQANIKESGKLIRAYVSDQPASSPYAVSFADLLFQSAMTLGGPGNFGKSFDQETGEPFVDAETEALIFQWIDNTVGYDIWRFEAGDLEAADALRGLQQGQYSEVLEAVFVSFNSTRSSPAGAIFGGGGSTDEFVTWAEWLVVWRPDAAKVRSIVDDQLKEAGLVDELSVRD